MAPPVSTIPMYLHAGTVAIYGMGEYVGVSGITPNDSQVFRLGMIYKSWDNTMIGESVMFGEADVTCRLAWANYPYTIVEQAKLAIIEIS